MTVQPNEPNERFDVMLRSLFDSDEGNGFTQRVVERIRREAVDNATDDASDRSGTAAERTVAHSWKHIATVGVMCAAVLVALVCLSPWLQPQTNQHVADVGSSADAAVQVGGPVILQLPAGGEAESRIRKAEWLPADFVLLTGRLNLTKDLDESMVELKVDRVIKGDAGDGNIIAKDTLPDFYCSGQVAASSIYPVGRPVLCWLTRDEGNWNLVEIEQLTPELTSLLDAVTGDDQAELLRPLVSPTGLDPRTSEMIMLVASPAHVTPLLKEVVRETPALLEPLKNAGPASGGDWQQRNLLISQRLAPAVEILCRFSEHKDTEIVDLILACYPLLQGEGSEALRYGLNYQLSLLGAAAQRPEGKSRFAPEQTDAVRKLLLDEVDDVGSKNSPADSWAWSALGALADSETVSELLRRLDTRPIADSHLAISRTLFQISFGGNATQADGHRIRAAAVAVLQELGNAEADDGKAQAASKNFASQLAGDLYQSDIRLSDLRALRKLHQETKITWLRKVVERFARKKIASPVQVDPDAKAVVTESDSTLTVAFSNDAVPDPAIIKRLGEWDGITEVRLIRSSRVLEILASLDEARLQRLSISYTPLTHDVLVAIGTLRSLRSLSIYRGGPWNPVGARELYRLRELQSLEFAATPLVNEQGEGVTALRSLTKLEKLTFSHAGQLIDWHLGRILNFPNLKSFSIDSPHLSSDGIDKFAATQSKLQTIVLPRILIKTSMLKKLRARGVKVHPALVDGSTRIWQTSDGRQTHAAPFIGDVDFMNNGTLLAVEEGDSVDLFDVATGSQANSFKSMLRFHERAFATKQALFCWRDGKKITLADPSGRTSSVDAFALEESGVPFGLFPSGKLIAVSGGKSIKVLDVATGHVERKLVASGHFSPSQIAVSEDGKYLAAASSNQGVYVWSLESGEARHVDDSRNVLVGFTGNGSTLLYLENRIELFAMDVTSGKSKRVLTLPGTSQPLFHSVSSRYFAYAKSDSPIVVDLYDSKTWQLKQQFQFSDAKSHFISAISLTPDGKFIAVSGNLNHTGHH